MRPGVMALGLALVLTAADTAAAATTVYINRCAGQCQFTGGTDNSVTNTSSVLTGTRSLSAFAHGDASFNAVTTCITQALAPFDIMVTTTDPSPAAHTELVIAGTDMQAGLSGLLGAAPQTCSYVANGPAFAFANTIGNDSQSICETALFGLGALAGLEPLFNCADVMTDLAGCGAKTFRNESSLCGMFSATTCVCGGGTTRNSFTTMRAVFGGTNAVFASGFEGS